MVQEPKIDKTNKSSKINKIKKANIIKKESVSMIDSSIESKSPYIVKICEKISKASIYLLVFFLPLFFLPWTINVLDFNKQALLMVLVFVAFFAWLVKVLVGGKLSLSFHWLHLPVVALFLVFIISTIFSLYPYGSFWGWPQVISEGLVSLFCLVLFYFLVINIFEKKEIFYLFVLFIVSSGLAMLYGILQLFGKFLFPFNFAQSASFNTIGTANGLAVFSAILLPLIIFLLVSSQKIYFKIIFLIAVFLSLVLLILVNFPIAWWLVMAGSLLTVVLWVQKKDLLSSRWLILPMFFLVMALFFALFRPQLSGLPTRPIEVSLTNKIGFNIGLQTLKENPLFAVLGSGPGTFIYNFSKHKDIGFNQNPFWNIRFEAANSKILTLLASAGILGVLSFLALIGLFFFYGLRIIFKEPKNETKPGLTQLGLGVFISFIILSLGFFIHQSNLSLEFVFFFLIAGLVTLIANKSISNGAEKEFILKPSSLITLGITFGFTLIFIFNVGIIFLAGQKYIAELNYFRGIKAWQRGEVGQTMNYLEKAVKKSPKNDLYLRELSQVYLKEIDGLIKTVDLSQDENIQRVQVLIYNSLDSAKKATEVNPVNVANWSVRGFIYQNFIGLVTGAKEWALKSYQEALNREPTNPYFPTQAGISLLREASFLAEDKKTEREKLFSEAQEYFNKALELKSDYAPAHFQLAMIYQKQGRQVEMTRELERARDSALFDVGLAFQLGLVYYQNKDYQKARTELERAILLDPNYANALYFLGLTYDQLNDKDKAIEKFKRVSALNLDNQEVKKILENLKAGAPALKEIVEEVPPQAPIKEEHPEIEE